MTLRDIERILIAATLAGSLIQGWRHEADWLLVPLAAYFTYVLIEDRALRSRIGNGHWPSEGFARFTLGTNLSLMVRNVALNGVVFLLAGLVADTLGF
jgi:hypothetical protein